MLTSRRVPSPTIAAAPQSLTVAAVTPNLTKAAAHPRLKQVSIIELHYHKIPEAKIVIISGVGGCGPALTTLCLVMNLLYEP